MWQVHPHCIVLKSPPLFTPHPRKNRAAYVSLNGKVCWTKTQITGMYGDQQCGQETWTHYSFISYGMDDSVKVTGCTATLLKPGPLDVRVFSNLELNDNRAERASFGIKNVVIRKIQSGMNVYFRFSVSCTMHCVLRLFEWGCDAL